MQFAYFTVRRFQQLNNILEFIPIAYEYWMYVTFNRVPVKKKATNKKAIIVFCFRKKKKDHVNAIR